MPEVVDALRPVDGGLERVGFPSGVGNVVDLAATERGLVLLCADGRILVWADGADRCREAAVSSVAVPAEACAEYGNEQRLRLHASRDGRFAAVVVDYGREGCVYDLADGRVVMVLENDGYKSGTVPFSLAFTEWGGRTVVVYRREWNIAEAADPGTGDVLTVLPAGPEVSVGNRYWREHFLGALDVSPGGTGIASAAWCWSPVGAPVAWRLEPWLAGGFDVRGEDLGWVTLPPCDYHWNRPLVWLDEDHVVLGGLGEDDIEIAPGARVFRLDGGAEPVEVAAFGGPEGTFFCADGVLFSSSELGLDIWDPFAGTRVGVLPGFRPTHHDRGRGELLELGDRGVRRWRIRL
ncbi:hypothetical protein [Streptomyces sp. NPDC089919]|uniref:hypothetical protein n=1 Tax=Streptomyces sp. NPDC089919 TaxID=3155188 RepID=UPI00342BD150